MNAREVHGTILAYRDGIGSLTLEGVLGEGDLLALSSPDDEIGLDMSLGREGVVVDL